MSTEVETEESKAKAEELERKKKEEEEEDPSRMYTIEEYQSLQNEVEKLKRIKDQFAEDSKKNAAKYREVRDVREDERRNKLEAEEKWKDLYETEKDNNFKILEDSRNSKKLVLKKELNFQVAKYANDAFDVSDVIHALPKEMVSIDEESLEVSGIEDSVNFLRNKKPWLFNTGKKSGMVGTRPIGEGGKVSFEDLSKEEQDKDFNQALQNLIS